ncbi:MAG: short-chain fatty acid transporter [Oligoflexia bacterium]|nr:short-chain fatty acid transporter [Oligoflexia bacterium]
MSSKNKNKNKIKDKNKNTKDGVLARFGLALAAWSEKWFPDSWIFALVGVVVIFIFGLLIGETPKKLITEGGKSFWVLIPFTMQMALIVIGGYVVATAPAVYWIIKKVASVSFIAKNPRAAIAWIAFFSMITSLISWGLSLIFSGLLVREMSRTIKGMDYRAAGAAAYLGLGAVWALGLSSSAAMMMATQATIPPKLFAISGLIPLTQTLFTFQNLLMIIILIAVSVLIAYLSAPKAANAKTVESFNLKHNLSSVTDVTDVNDVNNESELPQKPGEWLEYNPILIILVGGFLAYYLFDLFTNDSKGPLAALDLNNYNLMFITIGMLLHWRPKRFLKAVSESIPATGGIIIQFPFYAMIFGMVVGTGINKWLADLFVMISTKETYSLLVAIYSAVLGVFIPSGGSKWIIEAPYVLQASILHNVNLGWVVQIYNAAEALPNLLNPFWMLPLLGLLSIKARDIVGYTVLQMIVHIPIVFFLCWYFGLHLPFVAPVF